MGPLELKKLEKSPQLDGSRSFDNFAGKRHGSDPDARKYSSTLHLQAVLPEVDQKKSGKSSKNRTITRARPNCTYSKQTLRNLYAGRDYSQTSVLLAQCRLKKDNGKTSVAATSKKQRIQNCGPCRRLWPRRDDHICGGSRRFASR